MKLPELFTRKKKSNHTAWKVIGGTALALIAAGVLVNLPDIKKYIKISSM